MAKDLFEFDWVLDIAREDPHALGPGSDAHPRIRATVAGLVYRPGSAARRPPASAR